MKLLRLWCALAVAAAPMIVASSANAQPGRDHRGDHHDSTPTPATDHRPHQAPPAAKDETHADKAGYIWQAGRWNWKEDKWQWTPGHYERARAGKQWADGRWDKDGDSYSWHDGRWDDDHGTPGPGPSSTPPPRDNGQGGRGPRAAPPPPRPENHGAKDGYIWASGRWDWKADKWEWLDGHWERAQANRRWRDGRWDQAGDSWQWNDGGWDPDNNPNHAGPDRDHRKDWKLERPTVGSYWPAKGKAGARVVIKGENFSTDTRITWNGTPINATKIAPTRIVITIPGDATGVGTLALRGGRGRDTVIGSFEVAASYDAAAAAAEAARVAAQQKQDAEAAWAARQKTLARNQAARQAALDARMQERQRTRDDRRAQREAEIRARWERSFLADPDTQDELTLHAQRVATIQRMRDLAETMGDGGLVVRIDVAAQREEDRHDSRMAALHASFGVK